MFLYSCSGLTGLVPHIHEEDVVSGLSTKLLRQVVDKENVNEALLKYVVFRLPQASVKKPYDATGVDLIRILSKSTDYRLIEQLLELGMQLKPSQLEATVLFIPNEHIYTFELLLRCAVKNKFKRKVFNAACLKAMDMLKVDFITLLISFGATPPPDELVRIVGFSDNPTIQQYLAAQAIPDHIENPHGEMLDLGEYDFTYEKVHMYILLYMYM